ncbi:D-ribose pyranase [Chitiniphilus eburneus]|uniref:D-ribose pyranase n=1 Tax=Chitiniphilus eburneus TaxID=2571148 RepID=A0A4U0Q593_9NEIS|nr:D-ribose pyranase [Chitiniphilus eburneus]TJZ76327.1 D-ribose pyranase [Chitiniphilus eburneus]
MKKTGHLNRDISRVLAGMGHTDCIVIADCGLPIPPGVECIDLSLKIGVPRFLQVLDTVLADLQVERAVFANECLDHNAEVAERASSLARENVQVEFVPHEQFKALTRNAKAVIRTGEATPYANAVLYSGVIF